MRGKKFRLAMTGTVIVIVGLVYGTYSYLQKNGNGLDFETYVVGTGDVSVEVKVSGTAKLVDEQKLSFGQEGKINAVYVDVGDAVEAGDVLAELDLDTYNNNLKTAELELANSKLALLKLLENDTSLREKQIRNQISELSRTLAVEEEQYTILQEELEDALLAKRTDLTQKKRDLVLAKEGLEIAGKALVVNVSTEQEQTEASLHASAQAYTDSLSDIAVILQDAEDATRQIDAIFGATEEFKITSRRYANQLSATEPNNKWQTISALHHSYSVVNNSYETLVSLDEENVADLIAYSETLYDDMAVLVMMTDYALDALGASIVSTELTQTTIDGFETTVKASRSTAVAAREALLAQITTLQNLLSDELQEDTLASSIDTKAIDYKRQIAAVEDLETAIDLLEDDIDVLQQNQSNQLIRQQTTIDTLKNNRSFAHSELNDLLDGPDEYDVEQLENQVKQAELRVANIVDQKDDFQIVAEFDGRVRSVDVVVGEQYELDKRDFIVVENPNLIELELKVSQIDVVDIQEGNAVAINFDAYPNTEISAKIDSIDTNPIQNARGGVSYKATVLLEKQAMNIYAGMTALTTILADKKEEVIRVPILSIAEQEDGSYVEVVNEDLTTSLEKISVGISNNFYSEVTEGLTVGQEIRASQIGETEFEKYGITGEGDAVFGD